MAVVERKNKRGITYWIATSFRGRKYWERSGTNKRAAQALDAQRRREVKEGTFRPDRLTAAMTVKSFATQWLDGRKNRNAQTDRRLLELHVLSVGWFASLPMGDVRPKHLLKLIAEVRAAAKLAEKSISLTIDLLRVMFRDAVIGDTITSTPYVVPRGTLKRSGEKRKAYDAAEVVELLVRPLEVSWLTWNHVAFYTGMRCGEICGLRWGDWDDSTLPLGALDVERQYAGQVLKTERTRTVPVHPALRDRLLVWREQWEAIQCREPTRDDLMFPGRDGKALTKSSAYKAWLRSCAAAHVTNRSVHSTRHTFITFALRGGAVEKDLLLVTHNPKGEIIDRYNDRAWATYCKAVMAVRYGRVPVDAAVDSDSAAAGNLPDESSEAWTRTTGNPGNSDECCEPPRDWPSPELQESCGVANGRALVDARQLVRRWRRSDVHWSGRKARAA